MTKIKMLCSIAGDLEQYGRGQILDLPEGKAQAWVDAEVAIFLDDIHPRAKEIKIVDIEKTIEKADEITPEPIHPEAAEIVQATEKAVLPKAKRKYNKKK